MALCIPCVADMSSPKDDLSRAAVAMGTITRAPDGGCLGCGRNLKVRESEREEIPVGITGHEAAPE